MNNFKVNYYKLQNLYQIKYYKFIILIFILLSMLIFISCFMTTYHKVSFPGIFNNGILNIKINKKLSDILKNKHNLKFNNKKTTYEILSYGDYEIVDNEIYQEVSLAIEEKFINNEVGIVELYYDKEKVVEYILKLFK